MPPLLQDAWGDKAVKPDYSIDCVHDDSDDRFKVMRIGPGSPIAKLWGIFPVSYPCLMGNPYDQVVSEVYPEVVRTGEPHYGHVYAAMCGCRTGRSAGCPISAWCCRTGFPTAAWA
jgi:hypothetical protein